MSQAINLDHSSSTITTNNGEYLTLNKNGAIKIGNGTNIDDAIIDNTNPYIMNEYMGVIRFNEETLALEYCDGSKWVEILTEEENDSKQYVYSLTF